MEREKIYRCNRCRGGTPALYALNTGTVTGVSYPAPGEMGTLCLYCARDDADKYCPQGHRHDGTRATVQCGDCEPEDFTAQCRSQQTYPHPYGWKCPQCIGGEV